MDYRIFGCKLNKYYLNKWLNYFGDSQNDSLIISTCVVTDRAKKKCIKEILKLVPNYKKIYITGCISIDYGEIIDRQDFFEQYSELNFYQEKIELLQEDPGNSVYPIDDIYTKKFIVIQNGCDNNCNFCLSIKKRGVSRSRSMQEIIDEINFYHSKGVQEIVLTGINIAAYGATNTRNSHESKISSLLENVLKHTNVPRIRLSSLGPEYLDDRFFDVIKDMRIMNHFHISVQSFSDNVLKLMNRNYGFDQLDTVFKKFKATGDVSLGADLIVGFPGETEQDFDVTYQSVKDFNINKLHVFPFSAHKYKDTIPAGKFPNQIPQEEKKSRERKLIELGDKIRQQFLDENRGKKFPVLIEEKKNGLRYGWTPNYIQIGVKGAYIKGEIVELIY